MVLYNPHHNKENIFQQVGLISISVVGESLGRMQRETTPINIAEQIPQKVSAEEQQFDAFVQEKLEKVR